MHTSPDEESIIGEDYETLLQAMKANETPGVPGYEVPRHKMEFKLTDRLIRTGQRLEETVREQGDRTTDLTRSLVRLNGILVALTWVLVGLGIVAIVLTIWLR